MTKAQIEAVPVAINALRLYFKNLAGAGRVLHMEIHPTSGGVRVYDPLKPGDTQTYKNVDELVTDMVGWI